MMTAFGIKNRDGFFKKLLDDNMVEYDYSSAMDEWIEWGKRLNYIKAFECEVEHTKYQVTCTIEFTEDGKTYIEFLLL